VAVATGCGGVIASNGATGCGAAEAGAGTFIRTTGTGDGGGTLSAGAVVTVGTFTLIRGGAAGAAGGVVLATFGGGGAISVGGAVQVGADAVAVTDADNATGPVTFPNCRFTSSLIRADKSTPHSGQANVTGFLTMSGEASKAYLLPQSHKIFICPQGLGFNNTTFVVNGSAMDAADGDDFIAPSQNKNVPPYL
jgi:hypothetical protein